MWTFDAFLALEVPFFYKVSLSQADIFLILLLLGVTRDRDNRTGDLSL